jgi:hypothetical protein
MTRFPSEDRIACPGCDGSFRSEDLLALLEVRCPKCGREWQVQLHDVPGGRCLLDLRPPRET